MSVVVKGRGKLIARQRNERGKMRAGRIADQTDAVLIHVELLALARTNWMADLAS